MGLAASGVDLYLRDSKSANSTTDTSGSTTAVVNETFPVTDFGSPVAGATVDIVDATVDGETPGNYMIGFWPSSTTSGFGESPTKRTVLGVTSDAAGQITVKVSTATYSGVDCGHIPRSGIFTVKVALGDGTVVTVPFHVPGLRRGDDGRLPVTSHGWRIAFP